LVVLAAHAPCVVEPTLRSLHRFSSFRSGLQFSLIAPTRVGLPTPNAAGIWMIFAITALPSDDFKAIGTILSSRGGCRRSLRGQDPDSSPLRGRQSRTRTHQRESDFDSVRRWAWAGRHARARRCSCPAEVLRADRCREHHVDQVELLPRPLGSVRPLSAAKGGPMARVPGRTSVLRPSCLVTRGDFLSKPSHSVARSLAHPPHHHRQSRRRSRPTFASAPVSTARPVPRRRHHEQNRSPSR